MDILIRYWDSDKNIAITRYINSDGAEAEQILATFLEGTKNLDGKSLLQISSDGSNMNLKFINLYKNKCDLEELPTLTDIGIFGLHTVHGSLKVELKAPIGMLRKY